MHRSHHSHSSSSNSRSKSETVHHGSRSKGPSLDRQITVQDVECLREAFALFDPDKKETITPEKLGKVLRKHGFRPTEKELHTMIKNVDNHEGGIDFDEFIELLVNHGRNLEDDIAKSFRMFDIDGDGLITEEELQTTMSNLGEPMNEMEVKAMIAEADLDGDGKINFKEFQILMDNKAL